MSWYEFLLFVHFAGAAVWVGSVLTIQMFALRAALLARLGMNARLAAAPAAANR